MAYTNQQILEVLRKVKHPDKQQDIVSLGMVDEIKMEGNKLSFTLYFKKPNDPFTSSIKKACVQAIEQELGEDVSIRGNITVRIPEKKQQEQQGQQEQQKSGEKQDNPLPGVKNILAIASGKGGVGKSTVAANIAVAMAKKGIRVGLIDADIFGPSIPKMFHVEGQRPQVDKVQGEDRISPVEQYGVKMLSIGFFINPEDALVWRGPMATNALRQMIHQGEWGELDYLLIDLPPGTSDVHLTLVQELPVTGATIVSTPQNVALADAIKGIRMFNTNQINVPVLGLIENMSWFTPAELPENKYYIFGQEGCRKLAEKENLPLLGQIPIVQSIMESGEEGRPSALDDNTQTGQAFHQLTDNLIQATEERNQSQDPTRRVHIKK
jgi:ATP-binding protein involved in chromosome partitioning